MQRYSNIVGTVLVLVLSLLLLGYVGYGEAHRTYPRFRIATLAVQGRIVTNALQSMLLAGLPLQQFPGFRTTTQPLLASEPSIAAIVVIDPQGQQVFASTQAGIDTSIATASTYIRSPLAEAEGAYDVAENATFYRVTLPLNSKFEHVGSLLVVMPKSEIAQAINARFVYVVFAGGILLCVYTAVVWFSIVRQPESVANGSDPAFRRQTYAYGLACLVMTAVVIGALVNLYADGVQAQAQSLARTLQLRLRVPLDLGLDLSDFDQIDQTFKDNQALDPDISFIALTRAGRIVVATDPARVGSIFAPASGEIEYRLPLNDTEIHVTLSTGVIYGRLWRSVKNFIVLFVASAFLSTLVFTLMHSFSNRARGGASKQAFHLGLIKPLYFMSVFVEGLTTALLPPYFGRLARESHVNPNLVSILFTVYFVGFVVALIPAGRFAERRGNKVLLIIATGLIAISQLLMATITDFNTMIAIRAAAGLGQGMLSIGVQSFILDMAADRQKTQSAAIIVYGYNGGMISGTAIGALLAVYMGAQSVFLIASVIALALLVYVFTLIPHTEHIASVTHTGAATYGFFSGLSRAIRDHQFVASMVLIGIPAKAILTGVTIFALPLLLSQQHYAQEDIGQIIMLYSVGVLVSSSYISRLVDRMGRTTPILGVGALVSGIGLILIGLMEWRVMMNTTQPYLSVLTLSTGMILLGLAHGCIHAPIVTHITNTSAARSLGRNTTASLYRFLERIGHIAGPSLVSFLLVLNGGSAVAISWIGVAVIGLGVLFALGSGQRTAPVVVSEHQP